MKRKSKDLFEHRFSEALKLLLKNPGYTIKITNLHYRGAAARQLYARLTSTLDLMGIKYFTDKSILWIQVKKEPERPVGGFSFSDDVLDVSHYYGLAVKNLGITGRPITQVIFDDPL